MARGLGLVDQALNDGRRGKQRQRPHVRAQREQLGRVEAALASALLDRPFPTGSVFFGEVALSGAIRSVGRTEPRLREAARLGFTRAFAPAGAPDTVDGMTVHGLSRLQDLVDVLGGGSE